MSKIKLTINGKTIFAEKGETILDIALKNGVEIPNLCYEKELGAYGGCGLCLVEIKGKDKLFRACATVAEDGMEIDTETPRVLRAQKTALELLMSDHIGDCKGPCSISCPASTDVQGYLKQIAMGNYSEAVRIIKKKIPLPASIGRICPHPCEDNCRRNFADEPLSIAYLKAFAADMDMKSKTPFNKKPQDKSGKRVSIIGGGPAGLSAAYYLGLKGHSVTVYDAMPEMGGMLRYGIPQYRLPKEVLSKEIGAIENIGVSMKNDTKIGKDISFDEVRKNSDAVLVAIGAWKSGGIGCIGEKLSGVISGIDFLSAVNSGKSIEIGKNIAVIGGGNTAMDACRTAIRCGAENVFVIYRRTRAEVPARDSEIEEAIEEGVNFKFLASPIEIIGENGKVKKIKLQKMKLGEPDESGRRKPLSIDGDYEIIDVDTVISAIGQKCDTFGFDSLELTEKGTILANESNMFTNLDGVFAAGDAVNKGASIAINAIAEANKAAKAIDCYLKGIRFSENTPFYSQKKVSKGDYSEITKIPREKMPLLSADKRKKNFDEVILGFTEDMAKSEAKRCLECGCHDFKSCKLIKYANKYSVAPDKFKGKTHPDFTERKLVSIERDQGKCVLCALCVRTCDEDVKKGVLGLIGRGFDTVIKPEFDSDETINFCKTCHKCADICPTGALKIIK